MDARNNTLTVQTPGGDVATYDPHLSRTMTAESTVFRQEQREIAKGDRVQFTRTDADVGIRRGELGTVTAIDPSNLEVRLDKGSLIKLTADQARHIEHGYAIESVKAGAPERVIFTHDAAPGDREIAVLSRKGREVNLYISDAPAARNQETQVRESPRHPPPAPAETPSQAVPNHKFQSTAASLELQQFEKYHDAVQAERYRVTSIKMLPDGQNKIFILDKDKQTGVTRGFTPEEIAQRIPEMQRLQRRGENIYYTPLSDNKHHILIDDMNRPKFAKLIADGYRPAALIESSPGNYQAIVTLPKLGTPFDREVANRLTVELNQEYGDRKLSGAIHPHRAPGFENRKPKHMREDGSYPEVRLLKAERREDGKALEMTRAIDADYTQRAEKHAREAGQRHTAVASGQAKDLSQVYDAHRNDILARQKGDIDYSRLDSMIALRMRATHHDRSDIQAAILDGAPRSRPADANPNHQWEYYAQRTADSAYTPQADKQLESLAKYAKHWARLEARGSQDDNSQRNQQFEPAALSPAPSATTGNSDAALMPPERVSHRPRIRH
ncbi:traI protein (DNA helicase I) (plasmid) [Acidisarcina polymorpha]|uniref:TraI protein (DNA helicase I) n=1 Tax=Acidisarcina polymorpha TaxID=2211140 RepID=A0A2Z5GBD3_9BACT|nr:RepB family DNA primase [Acidisarcina polymorpha]AXC16240.1 traI protein (DNA helicase I) [Acidisarcina polymorpha]